MFYRLLYKTIKNLYLNYFIIRITLDKTQRNSLELIGFPVLKKKKRILFNIKI